MIGRRRAIKRDGVEGELVVDIPGMVDELAGETHARDAIRDALVQPHRALPVHRRRIIGHRHRDERELADLAIGRVLDPKRQVRTAHIDPAAEILDLHIETRGLRKRAEPVHAARAVESDQVLPDPPVPTETGDPDDPGGARRRHRREPAAERRRKDRAGREPRRARARRPFLARETEWRSLPAT